MPRVYAGNPQGIVRHGIDIRIFISESSLWYACGYCGCDAVIARLKLVAVDGPLDYLLPKGRRFPSTGVF